MKLRYDMGSLYEISTEVRNIYEELQSGIGVDEETGEILPEIQERLKFSKDNLTNKAVDYGYVIKSFEDEIDVYDREIKRLTERKKQMQNIQFCKNSDNFRNDVHSYLPRNV